MQLRDDVKAGGGPSSGVNSPTSQPTSSTRHSGDFRPAAPQVLVLQLEVKVPGRDVSELPAYPPQTPSARRPRNSIPFRNSRVRQSGAEFLQPGSCNRTSSTETLLKGRDLQICLDRNSIARFFCCRGALFGVRDQRSEAGVAVKRFEIGVFFHTQRSRRGQSMVGSLA